MGDKDGENQRGATAITSPEITIISVSVDSPEWAELLVKSIRKFTQAEYKIIIIDNGSLPQNLKWLEKQGDVRLKKIGFNIGHGRAMDIGVKLASGKFVCILDIDSHVQCEGWEGELKKIYDGDNRIRLIGCRGPEHKPLKPPLFYFERNFIIDNKILFRHIPGVSTDTAQKAYWDILALDYKIHRFVPGRKFYTCGGDQFWLAGKPCLFHHWYGTRFRENCPGKMKSELDGYKIERYLANKAKLFNQDLVKEILAS